jgi:hypothetical protein
MDLSNMILTEDGNLRDDIPWSLDVALEFLDGMIINKNELKLLHESTFMIRTYHTLGTNLRNKWRLWDFNSPLHRWFRENIEIFNADDMVMILLSAWHRHINDREYDLVNLAKKKLEWWEKQEPLSKEEIKNYLINRLIQTFSKLLSFNDICKAIINLYLLERTEINLWGDLADIILRNESAKTNKYEVDILVERLFNDLL